MLEIEITNTQYGRVRLTKDADSIEITTENWNDSPQQANFTRKQFTDLVSKLIEIMNTWEDL